MPEFEFKRGNHYNDWLAFNNKWSGNRMHFGYVKNDQHIFTVGHVADNLERAAIAVVSDHRYDLPSAISALGLFDIALDNFYSYNSPTFQGIREEMMQDCIYSSIALLIISSYVNYNIKALYTLKKMGKVLTNAELAEYISEFAPYEIDINNRVLLEAARITPTSNRRVIIRSDEDLKMFIN